MNTTKKTALILLLAGAGYSAGALTYADGDLLLVFRKDGFSDMEYNLGPVANFLGKPDGTAVPVPGWDLSQVKANFNNNLANVKFLLVAATASICRGEIPAWVRASLTTGTIFFKYFSFIISSGVFPNDSGGIFAYW